MNKTKSLCAGMALAFAGFQALAQTNVGQWDFTNGTLAPTVGSAPLIFADGATQAATQFGSTASFDISPINGTNANVMFFPASGASGGFDMSTAPLASVADSSALVNDYTIIMDVLFPVSAVTHVRPLVQTDDGFITPDADFVVDSTGGIGAPPGPFSGQIIPNTWYRIAFAVSDDEIDEYINGVEVGIQETGGTESRFALAAPGALGPNGYAELFQNSTTNGASPGYVSSIQLWNGTLSAGALAAIGAPEATKIPTNIAAIPSYLTGKVPGPNADNAAPVVNLAGTVNPGGTVIDGNSISVLLDGSVVTASITNNGDGSFGFGANPTNVLAPRSTHLVSVIYSDSVAGKVTNSWAFTVFNYQNVTLPAPIYFENFDELAEGAIPDGWVVTNHTTSEDPGLDITDPSSDFYDNWACISQPDYMAYYPWTDDYTSPGFPEVKGNRRQMIPPIVENGEFLTNLCSGNLMVAESDQRSDNQVQVMFTKDYDFTGHSNICVSFHNINEQNQDNICSVEYSIDQGTNWLPLLYMLDDGTTDSDGSDVVTNKATGQIDVFATFNTARNDQAWADSYGSFIGAPVSTNLIPYIRPCRNDDPVQQKRIEVFPLPAAANQKHVRLRFCQAGTGSWFFDIDDLGFYQIEQPLFVTQPTPVVADYNGPASFTTQVSGPNISYQWMVNGTNIPGANAATYTIPNTASNNIGEYSVVAQNTLGAITSTPVSLSLIFTPIFISPPLDVTAAPGDPVAFSVQARGGQPLSYQWLFNSNAIAGATNTTYNIPVTDATNSGQYQVAVRNIFSTVVSPPATLTVFAGPITNDMVLHLKFDGDYTDSSGQGNDGTPVGSPDFEPGFLGQAIHTDTSGSPANNPATNNYVTLGSPADLNFGSDFTGDSSDFSVSFWVKIFSQNDDQSFIGNKDWNSGGDPGWIIDTEGDGMKWNYDDNALNYPGVGSSRRDSPHVAPQMEDGGWHHVLVTFARHSVGTIYVDGALVNQTSLAPDAGKVGGSIDTSGLGYGINIGQDGTGHYTDGGSDSRVDMLVDDLAVWRRVLNRREATGIFNAGLNGKSVDQAAFDSVGAKPSIQVQPQDVSAQIGGKVTFYAGALGSPNLSYAWSFGATALSGQTNSTLTLANVQGSQAGGYYVIVTNSYGAATSRTAQLTLPGAGGVMLGAAVSGGNLVLTWAAKANVELETTPSLSPMNWTAVPGTLGAATASIPITGTAAYFRLVTVQ